MSVRERWSYIDAGAEEDVHEDLEEAQGLEGNDGSTDGTKDGDGGGVAVGFYGGNAIE